ncbi:hypothetical protein AAFC00_001277 [Neodothiora populina]|uniref:M protein, serotype 2.1 n=1 Tax=Neodothiora populina TaxID=2781224 RepID=A0ABR3PPD7_9PEZI
MSTPTKASTPTSGANRRPPLAPTKASSTPPRTPSRLTTPTAASSAANTSAKARTVRTGAGAGAGTGTTTPAPSARAAARKSVSHISKTAGPDAQAESDARAEAAAAFEDLRERLQKAEAAAEEHMKQAATLQARLDDATKEQSKLEESVHEQQERMEELENEKKESVRKRREIENIYETESAAAIKEREEAQAREEELRNTVQRLKETLAQKDQRVEEEKRPDTSRSSSFRSNASPRPDASQFAPPSSLERSDSRSSSRLLLQKDKIIESLRLELAEIQIKIAELENMGGGRVHELEKALLEAKVANGRLMEDNESFQLLLAEKTLHGDLPAFLKPPSDYGSRPPSRDRPTTSTLADELNDDASMISRVPSQSGEIDPAEHRRLLSELSTLKDQNKALNLYITNIISRLLQHKEFENILDRTPNANPAPAAPKEQSATPADVDKDLPPPPPPKDAPAPSFLQRATSVVRGRPRPAPLDESSSQQQDKFVPPTPGVTEDPATAPRVPLGRPLGTRQLSGGHRRANSEWTHASVVSNMYRGPSPGSGQRSPGVAPQRASTFFGPNHPAAVARMPSTGSVPRFTETISESRRASMQQAPTPPSGSNRDSKIGSSRNSIISDSGIDAGNDPSPPPSTTSGSDKPSGAIIGGNKMRPLRLVQEANEEQEAQKKANRSSWMGWFNKGANAPKPGVIEPPLKE